MAELSIIEQRVARLAAEGCGAAEIAASLGVDKSVVQWHLGRALRKLAEASELHRRLTELDEPR